MPSERAIMVRRRLDLRGQVQGVGFRPFVYRLAVEASLAGHVANNSNGAVIEVEGPADSIAAFERDLLSRLPPLARITRLRRQELEPLGEVTFRIRGSQADRHRRPEVTPDAATCRDCLTELFDPADRRYRYAFINCTNCGPRYSIIRTVPYDRPTTTMAAFELCPPCGREYSDPADRRFHAQPNACPDCGPRLRLCRLRGAADQSRDRKGAVPAQAAQDLSAERRSDATMSIDGDPIREAARLLAEGRILAIKGIGGYHLSCRADREDVVQRLRQRKLRDGKPLAVMVPSEAVAKHVCRLSDAALEALKSASAPIVLAPKNESHGLAQSIAPGCDTFGIMLPYAPVHHLLFAEGLGPLVMTSANLAGQPLTCRDEDAFRELDEVADAFLVHDREIFRPIDDSVVVTFRTNAVPIRRARGFAPRPLRLKAFEDDGPLASLRDTRILAVGGDMKSTVCLLASGEAILSEHLGDLSHPDAYRHFVQAVDRLKELFGFMPDFVTHDLHPRYLSTHYARALGVPTIAVQHHHAHIASVMAECSEPGPVIGLSCDGTGYGTDGAVWGGEVLFCRRGEFERVGHIQYFPLLGGDVAAVENWRPAAALLREAFGPGWIEQMTRPGRSPHGESHPQSAALFRPASPDKLEVAERQIAAGLNTPPTSSLGRVFDAVSYLLGLCSRNRHEAEAAMALEAAAAPETVEPYAYEVGECDGGLRLSLLPTIREICRTRQAGEPVALAAARFHETIAHLFTDAAITACEQRGVRTVALSGGCFANRRLLTRLVELLEARHLQVLYHREVPSGDGGLALGQAIVAAWRSAEYDRSPVEDSGRAE